jgi:hypothetical protein
MQEEHRRGGEQMAITDPITLSEARSILGVNPWVFSRLVANGQLGEVEQNQFNKREKLVSRRIVEALAAQRSSGKGETTSGSY